MGGVPPVDLFRQTLFQFLDSQLGPPPVGGTLLQEAVDSAAQIADQEVQLMGLGPDFSPVPLGIWSMTRRMS